MPNETITCNSTGKEYEVLEREDAMHYSGGAAIVLYVRPVKKEEPSLSEMYYEKCNNGVRHVDLIMVEMFAEIEQRLKKLESK